MATTATAIAANGTPKSLVMLDATGKVASLKLTTSTGLHVYDGSMLWVNPAQTVTATAPRTLPTGIQPSLGLHKPTKALPIVDPSTGNELVVKKPEAPAPPPAPVAPAPAPTQPPRPASSASSMFPMALGSSVGAPSQALSAFPSISPVVVNPSATSIFTPPAAPVSTPAPAPTKKETNIIDLLAKATKQSPSKLLAMTKALPPVQAQPRDRDRDYDRDQGRSKGRAGGKGAPKSQQPEGKGKGRGARVLPTADDQRARRKVEAGRYPGERYTKGAKYTASLDGRFWSLSCWPTGERDADHRLTFGKHKLDVLEDGVVKVVLYGGVNRYKVRLHLCTEDDDSGSNDKDGWGLASCEPNAANLQLSEEAEHLGWKIFKGADHPLIYPPGVPVPEATQSEEKKTESGEVAESQEGTESATPDKSDKAKDSAVKEKEAGETVPEAKSES